MHFLSGILNPVIVKNIMQTYLFAKEALPMLRLQGRFGMNRQTVLTFGALYLGELASFFLTVTLSKHWEDRPWRSMEGKRKTCSCKFRQSHNIRLPQKPKQENQQPWNLHHSRFVHRWLMLAVMSRGTHDNSPNYQSILHTCPCSITLLYQLDLKI